MGRKIRERKTPPVTNANDWHVLCDTHMSYVTHCQIHDQVHQCTIYSILHESNYLIPAGATVHHFRRLAFVSDTRLLGLSRTILRSSQNRTSSTLGVGLTMQVVCAIIDNLWSFSFGFGRRRVVSFITRPPVPMTELKMSARVPSTCRK
jgi:hypothetical protein